MIVPVVLIMILPILACEFGFSTRAGEPSLEQRVTCRDVTPQHEPIGPTNVFNPTDDLYVSVHYLNLEEGQEIEFGWFQGENFIYETPFTTDASTAGDGHVAAWLTNPQPWSAGDYHIDVFLDGELDHSLNFRVQ
jgi:hypothetical protein